MAVPIMTVLIYTLSKNTEALLSLSPPLTTGSFAIILLLGFVEKAIPSRVR